MKKLLLITFIFPVFCTVYAQGVINNSNKSAISLHNQAILKYENGEYKEDYELTESALSLLDSNKEEDARLCAEYLHDLAMLSLLGQYDYHSFSNKIEQAINLKYKLYGKTIDYYWSIECYGDGLLVLSENMSPVQKIYYLEAAIKQYELIPQHDTLINYGIVHRKLAQAYEDVDIVESIKYELRYLSLQRQYGNDADTLTTFLNLVKYYKEEEEYDNAKSYLEKVKSMFDDAILPNDKRIVELYMEMASLYGRIGNSDSAFVCSEKAKKLESNINGSNTETYATIVINSALYKYKSGDVAYCLNQLKQMYQYSLSNKLNVAFNLASVYSNLNDADSCYLYLNEAWKIVKKDVLSQMDNLSVKNRFSFFMTERTYNLITSPINYFLQHKDHKGLKRLAYNCILFYKNIAMGVTSGDFGGTMNVETVDMIKKILKEDEIAIELWSDLSDSWYSDHIQAFIVSPDEEDPIFVELSKDSIYMALNNKIETSESFLPLYETIWKNLLEKTKIKKKGKIYISCDDIYHIIPIESIYNYDFEYIGDVYSVIRVSHTGNIPNIKDDVSIKDVALYGGLDYQCSSTEENDDKLFANVQDTTIEAMTSDYRAADYYLPWTQIEIDSINAILQSSKEINKIHYFNKQYGTEESFKSFSGNSPSIIHLATHGYFSQPKVPMSWYDYYNYCMENAGLRLSCSVDSIDGYGLLSAEKIRYLDLSKTDILVLSACNTGKGGITPYGIFGLQRAFKEAGVGSVIMTLGTVDDAATYYFMTSFYRALVSGLTKRDAFKFAQNQIRENEMFENYSYWYSFIMID